MGTLVVNVPGSFITALFAALTDFFGRCHETLAVRQFFVRSACGGATTFSQFSLQTLTSPRDSQCLMAVWIGNTPAFCLNLTKVD